MDCGCKIVGGHAHENVINFCPLHVAAGDLLEAAEVAIACMAMEGDHKHHDAPCWLDALTIAHAKAKVTP